MKKFLLVVLVLLLVAGVVGFFLPHDFAIEESIDISAKPSAIHDLVGDLKRWDEWTPFKEMDPSVQVTFGRETTGVGASQSWTSKDGSGTLTFTASDKKKGVEYTITLGNMPAQGAIRYEPVGDTTKVTWSMKGKIETPVIGGYFALLMPRMVGGAFEKGLSKLKRQVER